MYQQLQDGRKRIGSAITTEERVQKKVKVQTLVPAVRSSRRQQLTSNGSAAATGTSSKVKSAAKSRKTKKKT
jgi:hypothetical protein